MKNYIYSERVDLFEPNIYIQFHVQIGGNPDINRIISAVKVAFMANEATLSRIVLENDGTAYYEKMNQSGCNVAVTSKHWKELIRENEKIPFRIDKGELIRVFVIPSGEATSLLIMAHHLVGDGKSITYFLEDIMKVLSGEQLIYKPIVLITPDSFPKKSDLPFYLKLYISRLNIDWNKCGREFTWEEYFSIHKTYWKSNNSEVIYDTFTPEELNRIKSSAKKAGVSVNSYITTAFLAADRDNRCVGIPVDVRMCDNYSMSNQTTGISINNRYSDKISFEENAKIVHQKIYKKINKEFTKYLVLRFIVLLSPSLMDSVLLYTHGLYRNKVTQKLSKVMGYCGGKTKELGITNLTKLGIPNKYGPYVIKTALFIPPVVSYAKHIIGVSTLEDCMTISYHFMNSEDADKEQKFFYNGIRMLRECGTQAE